MLQQITILGVGLMGGSLALALRRAGFCQRIIGCSRNENHLQIAQSLSVIDDYDVSPEKAIVGSELIILAVPLGSIKPVLQSIATHLTDNTIITDVGSAKSCVIQDAQAVFGEIPEYFVPAHPIAGTEKSGVEAAFADLYSGHRVILTPTATTHPQALQTVRAMWQAVGAIVSDMSAEHHDQVLALTSHLPHMLAFGLVDGLAKQADVSEIFEYAAGGFRDFSRIASSDPVMWRDICLHNRDALLEALTIYRQNLAALSDAIENNDADSLQQIFTSAKNARDQFTR